MMLFDFHLPTKICLGNGVFKKTPTYLKQLQMRKRIFIVSDPGIIKIGLVDRLETLLSHEGFITQVFQDIKPNPRDQDCILGGKVAKEFRADVIIALGGGSVIDAAKIICVLQTLGGTPQEYRGKDKIPQPVTPLIVIPTTAGTGSEVTRSSVISDTLSKTKFTVKDVKIAPKLAIVDPELTYDLPPHLTASTGMDALVHAIEAYTCKEANPISDALALKAMELIYPNLRKAFQNGKNQIARYNLMVGSTIAGMAFSHADVAAVHCMAEAIGGLYDTPHGVANSMFLPYLIEYNAVADISKHATIARTIGIATPSLSDVEAAEILVKEMKKLAEDLSIPTFNSLPGVNEADFDYLAQSAYENGSTPSNARVITKEDYLILFEKAYKASK
ncbi:MAG: iron-containing alcohol dehydrogenase [Peptococcales bacterium]|jgi:alcohol dehydrogenase